MELKMTKRRKLIFAVFVVLLVAVISAGTVGAAGAADVVDYDSLPDEVLKRLTVKNIARNAVRSIEYNVLCFFAKVVDYFDNAVQTIMEINLYDIIGNNFPDINMYPLAWAILSFVVVLTGLMMIIYPDKLKISDTLRNIIVSGALIVALPSFIAVLGDLRTQTTTAVDNLGASNAGTVDNEEGLFYGLGDDILSSYIMDFELTQSSYQLQYYDEGDTRSPQSIYNLMYNSTLDTQIWNKSVDKDSNSSGTYTSQWKYSELTTEKMMNLLGWGGKYNTYLSIKSRNENTGETNRIIDIYDDDVPFTDIEDVENEQATFVFNSFGMSFRLYDMDEYQHFLIHRIAYNDAVVDAGLTNVVLGESYINTALEQIKDTVIKDLNVQRSQNIGETLNNSIGSYTAHELLTTKEYDGYNEFQKFRNDFWYGDEVYQSVGGSEYFYKQALYEYDVDFFETLFVLVIVLFCLIFAGLKLSSLLYDILFMQIIAPIVMATDMNGSTRAKKMINELVVSFVMFAVVGLILKIYIWVLHGIFDMTTENILVKLFLVLAGAKFVIDGPDIIVKLTGIDAGVKSGAATLMGMHSAVQTASSVAKNVKNEAKAIVAAPARAADSISNAVHTAKDTLFGTDDNTSKSGQAFNNAQSGEKGSQGTTGSSGSSTDGSNGKDGGTGQDGQKGNDGQQGETSKSSEKGESGTDGSSGEKGTSGIEGSSGEKGTVGHGFDDHNGSSENSSSSGSEGQGFNNAETTASSSDSNSFGGTYAESQIQNESNGFAQQEMSAESMKETYGDKQKSEEDKK